MSKKVKIILASILILFFGFFLVAEWWVEAIFLDIINKNPDRAYDISYDDLDLHTFFKGLTLKSAAITPLHVSDSSTAIHGKVEHIEVNGIRWRDLLFLKQANIRQLIFIRPEFQISVVQQPANQQPKKEKESTKGIQGLFRDILSRGEIHSFRLEHGSVEARRASDSMLIGRVQNLILEAKDIETDSLKVKNLIPFQVSGFFISLDSTYIHLNEYTELRTGYLEYHKDNSEFQLNNISLSFTKDKLEVSNIVGEQTDLIEVEVKLLQINQLDAQSNLYSDLDIRAKSILIDGLILKDFRDKNKPRPLDTEKPMFEGMVESMPIPLKVDSIIIRNSDIYYTELGENKSEAGTIHFADLNGSIVNVTTIPEFKEEYKSFNANFNTKLNQGAKMSVALEVPYEKEVFNLHVRVGSFNLGDLNTTIIPLADIEVTSGIAHKIDFQMNAERTESSNVLTVDYDNLGLEVLKDYGYAHNKRGLISSIANSAIRKENMPDTKHYHIAEYKSYRNIYRGPFNFMWESAKEGMLYIVPTGAAGLLLGNPEKKAEKKQEKETKKKKKKS